MSPTLVTLREATDEFEVNNSSSASNSEYGRSRRDTEQILDYYQSEDAGKTYINPISSQASFNYPERPLSRSKAPPLSAQSAMRSSSVGRDSNGNPSKESIASSSGGVQRRTSQRSAGGADKRRLAIVELDTSAESGLREQTLGLDVTLLARRGVDSSRLGGLAIVAPPDAHSQNYMGLSPIPVSAPPTGVPPTYQETKTESSRSGHQRSMSEANSPTRRVGTKAAPRDVGIVGTMGSMCGTPEQAGHSQLEQQRPSTSDGRSESEGPRSNVLTAPVFQTPRSRSPSPLPGAPSSSNSEPHGSSSRTTGQGQLPTPTIGQEKEIGRPVVAVGLVSGQAIIGRSPRSMTNGLPGTESSHTGPFHTDRDTPRVSGRLPFKPNQPVLSYLHYQPGVHSTAGPLPSPPRTILTHPNTSPPPRPPRVLSPPLIRRNESFTRNSNNSALSDGSKSTQIASKPLAPASLSDSEYSISAVSASSYGSDEKLPALSSSALSENEAVSKSDGRRDQSDKTPSRNAIHIREGAFPPSSVFLSHSSQPPPSQSHHQNLDKLVASIGGTAEHASNLSSPISPSVAGPPVSAQGRPGLKREDSWVSLGAESYGDRPDDISTPSSYPPSPAEETRATTTAVESDDRPDNRKRASLPAPPPEHRRVHSLPRVPSLLTLPRPIRFQASSPLSQSPLPKKAPTSWPDSMNFSDVLAKKTAAERAHAYSAKIQELTTEQTGLKEWLLSVRKERRPGESPNVTVSQAAATFRIVGKQHRHLSHASMASEVTFPIRKDSYAATDLTARPPSDISVPLSPTVVLPYPSLAHGVGIRRRSSRTFAMDSSAGSLSGSSKSIGSGFFASIGRKASLKKDRSFSSTAASKLLPSKQPPQPPQPRPIKLGTPPTLPGGPRAPVRSTQRAQSVLFKAPEPPRPEGQASTPARSAVESTPSIDLQVQKLADLLPHADKEILAGYLRRAQNQDPMSAIGTYLEDEKQGCLRRD